MAKKTPAAPAAATEQTSPPVEAAPDTSSPAVQLPTRAFDNGRGGGVNAEVVVGRLTAITHDGTNRILVITDRDGGERRAACNNNQTLWTGLWSHGLSEQKEFGLEGRGDHIAMLFCKLDLETQNRVLQTNEGLRRDTVFRIALDGRTDHGTCIGMVTDRYKVINAEDLVPVIQEALPGASVEVIRASSGVHGGILRATTGTGAASDTAEPGAFNASVIIDCGAKNGITALSGTAAASILRCSNEVTMEVRSVLGPDFQVPLVAKGIRIPHAGDYIASLKTQLGAFVGGPLEQIRNCVASAISTPLTDEQVGQVLSFYRSPGVKRISRKTADLVLAAYNRGEEVQHVPGTLYGLAMAVTYVGSHNEETSDGVNERLRQLGGELLLVSPNFANFMPVALGSQSPPDPVKPPKAEKPVKQPRARKAKAAPAAGSTEGLPPLPEGGVATTVAAPKRRSKKAPEPSPTPAEAAPST